MVSDYIISIVIGFACACLICSGWVTYEMLKVRARCGKVLEIVMLNMRMGGNIKVLPWYCTKEFIEGIRPVQEQLQQLGDLVTASDYKIQLVKYADYTMRVIIAFKLTHENGISNAQAIMHKTPSRVMIHQLALF